MEELNSSIMILKDELSSTIWRILFAPKDNILEKMCLFKFCLNDLVIDLVFKLFRLVIPCNRKRKFRSSTTENPSHWKLSNGPLADSRMTANATRRDAAKEKFTYADANEQKNVHAEPCWNLPQRADIKV